MDFEKKITINSKPIPQGRPRFVKKGFAFDPNKEKKNWIKYEISRQFKENLKFPIEIHMTFFMMIPKSTSKKKRLLMLSGKIKHTKKPDFDNLSKLPSDCMNGIVYVDDSQIYKATVEKVYDDNPRTEIIIKWSDDV